MNLGRNRMATDLIDLGDNFGKQMDLMGQITALLKVEMHILAERKMLEAELAKVKEKATT
jgi:hypothetical protein